MNDAHPSDEDASTRDLVTAILNHIRENGDLALWLRSAAHHQANADNPTAFAGDVLHGGKEIAAFLYGDPKHDRKVYRLVAAGKLPHFRIGSSICSRKSVLLNWAKISTQQFCE